MSRPSARRFFLSARLAPLLGAVLLLALNVPPCAFAQESATPPAAQPSSPAVAPPSPPAVPPGSAAPADERFGAPAASSTGDATPGESFPAPFGVESHSGPGALPHDLSPLGMYQQADVVVKTVLIGLGIASIVNLAILIGKSFEISLAKRRARRAIDAIIEAHGLSDLLDTVGRSRGPGAEMVRAAADEVLKSGRSEAGLRDGGLKERVSSRLGRIESGGGRALSTGTGILATIGSTAPFIGLFGTVWGIMNAFIGIAQAQTTNLAIVAPGIAEALFATAVGLVAAIPAVVIYNVFARQIGGYRALLGDASAGIERLVSRDLDRGTVVSGNLRLVAERA